MTNAIRDKQLCVNRTRYYDRFVLRFVESTRSNVMRSDVVRPRYVARHCADVSRIIITSAVTFESLGLGISARYPVRIAHKRHRRLFISTAISRPDQIRSGLLAIKCPPQKTRRQREKERERGRKKGEEQPCKYSSLGSGRSSYCRFIIIDACQVIRQVCVRARTYCY